MGDESRVLVVGGGPVGLTLAAELHRHGVACRLIETKTERETWSKAAVIQPRTLEVLRDMGLADDALDIGRRFHAIQVRSGALPIAHLDIAMPGSPYPFLLGLSQRETEELLEAHLGRLGGRLERGVQLAGFEADDTGVSARLTHLASGAEERVRVPYLIGSDGAHSLVRKTLGLPFEGSSFEQRIIQADIRADFGFEVDPGESQMFVSPAGPCAFLPLLGEQRYRMIVLAPPDEVTDQPTLDDFVREADARCGIPVRLYDPAWMLGFRFHGRIVPRYRVGRVFLAGDAAHIHSPVGGQGMNLGMQDAYNLAWKLALVLRGVARPALLDSYDAERRAVGAGVVRGTDVGTRQAMRFMTLRNPIAASLRNQIVSTLFGSGLFTDRVFSMLGGLNVEYGRSPAVGQHHISVWQARVTEDPQSELPDLHDWIHFEKGPGPGERVAELLLPDGSSLFDRLVGIRHQLLLFDGVADTPGGYANLDAIAQDVMQRFGHSVDVVVVVPRPERPAALSPDVDVLLDPELLMHQHFGSRMESLYLIRPDGYVGYRSQPADAAHLREYLERIFL